MVLLVGSKPGSGCSPGLTHLFIMFTFLNEYKINHHPATIKTRMAMTPRAESALPELVSENNISQDPPAHVC